MWKRPEGEWKPGSGGSGRFRKRQRAERVEAAGSGCKPRPGVEREVERVVDGQAWERSSRPEALTLEWSRRNTGAVIGEQKAVASNRLRSGNGAARSRALIPRQATLRRRSSKAKRPAVPIAVLRAVHARGEQGSGTLIRSQYY
jgi:hypothetical protein